MASQDRWRCLEVGCNPKLREHNAQQHREQTSHRVAKWPVRSAAGERKQRERYHKSPYGRAIRAETNRRAANGGEWGDE